MNIRCDLCKKKNKGRYRTQEYDGKLITACYDCLGIGSRGPSDKTRWEQMQTPFWKLMGQKPKPKDIAYEKYLKSRNMTYGDAVLERNYKGPYQSAMSKFEKSR